MKPHFIALSVLSVGLITVGLAGLAPDQYLLNVRHQYGPQRYPAEEVSVVGTFMIGETAVAWAILRPRSYRRSWARALIAALLLLLLASWLLSYGMHMPDYYFAHVYWLALGGISLLLLSAWSAKHALRERHAT